MWQISSSTYEKILVGFALILTLSILHQLRIVDFGLQGGQSASSVKVGDSQEKLRNPQPNVSRDDSIEQAMQTLAEFKVEALTSQKPEVSFIGRNLFGNGPVRNFSTMPTVPPFSSSTSALGASRIESLSPSIRLDSISPDTAFAQGQELKLVVRGENFKPEVKIYVNGNPDIVATRFVSPQEVQTTLSAQVLAVPRSLRIEVKRPGDERLTYSNPLTFKISPLPLTFLGEISEQGGRNTQVILLDEDERLSIPIGGLVKGRWKIVTIVGDFLELEDVEAGTRYRLKRGESLAKSDQDSSQGKESDQQASVDEETEEKDDTGQPGTASPSSKDDVNLLARPERPMTYKELLQRRAVMRQKR
jgi:hypothetical protein